jgi:hypothetical protein
MVRGELQLEVELESDTAPLATLVATLLRAIEAVHWLRDPTRGGLATLLNELALKRGKARRRTDVSSLMGETKPSAIEPSEIYDAPSRRLRRFKIPIR